LDLRASAEAKAMSKVSVGLKTTTEDQDCLKPRAEPKLKVAVESEQTVRTLLAMSRAYNKAASGSVAVVLKLLLGKRLPN